MKLIDNRYFDYLGDYDFEKDNIIEATNTSQLNATNNGNANNGNTNNGNKSGKAQRAKGQQNKSPSKNKSNNTTPAANGQQIIVNGSSSAPDADSA